MNNSLTVLLLENNASDASLICGMLQGSEFCNARVVRHAMVNDVLEGSITDSVGVVLISLNGEGDDCIETFRKINSRFTNSSIIVLTKTLDEPLALAVIREGAQGYLTKEELDSQKLCQAIRFSLERNAHITKLKQSYEALRLSEQRFGKLFHNNPAVAMVLSDDDGVFIEVNEVFLTLMELSISDVIGKKSSDLDLWVNPHQRNKFVAELRQGGVIRNRDAKLKSKSGRLLDLLFSMDILDTEGGSMLISSAIDITDRLHAEKKLLESESNLDTLLSSSRDAIWLVDKDMRLVKSNRVFREAVKQWSGMVYKTGDILFPSSLVNSRADKWKKFYERVLDGERLSEEITETSPQGETCYFEITMSPVYDDQQQIIGSGCFRRDITRQKETEKNIQSVKERYDILSMATNDAIWDLDMRTETVTWNHGLETIFGFRKEEIESTRAWRLGNIHPEDYEKVMDKINSCFALQATNWSATYRFKCADGKYKYVYDRGYVLYDNQQPRRMTGALQDIDRLMKAIEEIRKLSLVASTTDNLVIITDGEQRIDWVNESFVELMGYTLEEVAGKIPTDFLPGPDTDPAVISRLKKTLIACQPVSEEILSYSKDGKPYWLKVNINPVFDKKGKVSNFISVITDVTPHKAYEKNITAIAREQSLLISSANAIIFGVDRNGYVNEWNKLAADTTGLSKNDILEKKLMDTLIHPDNQAQTQILITEVLNGNPVSRYEFPIISRSGEQRILLLSATPRRTASDEIIGLIAVGQDITELTEYKESLEVKVAERTRELEAALQNEKELATLKSRFASMVSHEFRTPLSTIKLSVDYLNRYRSRLTGEEIEKKFQTVLHQVEHMAHMLEDILTLGKASENKIQIFKTKVDMPAFLTQIIEEVENSFNGSHEIHFTRNSALGEIVTDDALLRNIFINLLNNAIKFSPHSKEVCLDARLHNGHIIIEVRDNGLGIPASELPNIYDPFHRGSNVDTIQGTGLGLPIVKKAVDLIGGQLSVKSKVGVGSVFCVSIPVH